MSLNRYAKRRDANESALVKELRQCGLQVIQQDFPDLAVRRTSWPAGQVQFLEVDGITQHRKRSAKQLKFLKQWSIPRVKNAEDVLAVVFSILPATSVSCTSPPISAATSSVAAP
jgi:hypothetical protein